MSIHQERLNAEFIKILSECIRELRDPRISSMTTLTRVEITGDLKYAKVYVSVYDKKDENRTETVKALNGASGTLMHLMNGRIKMRRVPSMKFVLDDTIAYSIHISSLIDEINKDKNHE